MKYAVRIRTGGQTVSLLVSFVCWFVYARVRECVSAGCNLCVCSVYKIDESAADFLFFCFLFLEKILHQEKEEKCCAFAFVAVVLVRRFAPRRSRV